MKLPPFKNVASIDADSRPDCRASLSLDQHLQFLLYRTATPQALELALSKLPNEANGSEIKPEFEVFGQLPTEIQLKIWETAVSDPQVICVNQYMCYAMNPDEAMLVIEQQVFQPYDDKMILPFIGTYLRIYEYSHPFLKRLSAVCHESRKAVQKYEASRLEPLHLDLYFNIESYDDLDQSLLDDRSPSTGAINFADDTLFLTSTSTPTDFSLAALAITLGGGAQRIRHLAISHGWFESPEFNRSLHHAGGAATPQVPNYGRMLQLVSRFAELRRLDIVIGIPEWLDRWESGPLRWGEISLEEVNPKHWPPENFMVLFCRTFFPDKADKDVCFAELAQDINDLFKSAKDGHCDTKDWKAAHWKVPQVAFKIMKQDTIDLVPQ